MVLTVVLPSIGSKRKIYQEDTTQKNEFSMFFPCCGVVLRNFMFTFRDFSSREEINIHARKQHKNVPRAVEPFRDLLKSDLSGNLPKFYCCTWTNCKRAKRHLNWLPEMRRGRLLGQGAADSKRRSDIKGDCI